MSLSSLQDAGLAREAVMEVVCGAARCCALPGCRPWQGHPTSLPRGLSLLYVACTIDYPCRQSILLPVPLPNQPVPIRFFVGVDPSGAPTNSAGAPTKSAGAYTETLKITISIYVLVKIWPILEVFGCCFWRHFHLT